MPLLAFEMDDEPTIYAAESAEKAAEAYLDDCGEAVDGDLYPRQLSDTELDRVFEEFDEDGAPTGRQVTLRIWLGEMLGPGVLSCVDR